MPLIHGKSNKAFEHNLKTELKAGKPKDQALAISYDIKRRNAKKMAKGGEAHEPKLGSGKRFEHLEHSLAHKPGIKDPAAVAAAIGRNKYGAKKMSALAHKAEGGEISASDEKRPMPEDTYNDSEMERQNAGMKAPKDDQWLDQPTVRQAQAKGGMKSSPKGQMGMDDLVDIYDDEHMRDDEPGPYGAMPKSKYAQTEGKHSSGSPDMEDEHSTRRKPYAEGGRVKRDRPYSSEGQKGWTHDKDYTAGVHRETGDGESYAGQTLRKPNYGSSQSYDASVEKAKDIHKRKLDEMRSMPDPDLEGLASGGMVDEQDYEARPNRYMRDVMDLTPSEDEGSMYADEHDEMDPMGHGPDPDMEKPHNMYQRSAYFKGGEVPTASYMKRPSFDAHHEEGEQPEDEADDERHSSLVASIMSERRMDKEDGMSGSKAMDDAVYMARGGEIVNEQEEPLSHRSIYSDDSSQVDLSRNAEEDANEEDQLSTNALKKENYSLSPALRKLDQPEDSNEHGDDIDSDHHDMVEKIRREMRSRRR